jgi:retinoid hydroxylase
MNSITNDETAEYFASPIEYFKKRPRRGVIRTALFGRPAILLVGTKAHEFVHFSHRHLFSHGRGYVRVNETFGGPHLQTKRAMLALDGDEWRAQRDLILPMFGAARLKVVLEEKRRLYEERMQAWPGVGEVDVLDELHNLTLAGALRGLYGIRLGSEFNEFRRLVQEIANVAMVTYGQPGALDVAASAHRRLTELLAPHIEEKRIHPSDDGLSHYATTTAVAGRPLTNEEILSCLAGQIFAAFSTTKSLMTFCFYFMARYREYAGRVLDEASRVLGNEPPDYAHLSSPKRLPALDGLVKEAERMYAPLHLHSRGVLQSFVFEGQEIPEGAVIHVAPLATHYDPEIFAAPELFDPDRFAPPREEDKGSPYVLDAFGGGERVCLGKSLARMDIKLALIMAFRSYRLELLNHRERLDVVWGPDTAPRDGLKMSVRHLA